MFYKKRYLSLNNINCNNEEFKKVLYCFQNVNLKKFVMERNFNITFHYIFLQNELIQKLCSQS
jgi:hypothetical protein